MSAFLQFIRDQVCAAANALAANLGAVGTDEPIDLIVPLATERAVSIAHDAPAIFQSEAGASAPFAFSAAFITAYVFGGNFSRHFHVGTADMLLRLVSSLTASGPPSATMTSSTVFRRFIMPDPDITRCDIVKPHNSEFETSSFVYQNEPMVGEPYYPYAEQGRRLRWLRQAEGIQTATAFAARLGWPQSGMSQFESGKRRVPADKALQLRTRIPGFDPVWLWEGDKRGLAFDLRKRIEAEEAKEETADALSRRER